MLNFIKNATQRVQEHLIMAGRHRARASLLAQNDRLLSDMGFSRNLLEQGVHTWPWREESSAEELVWAQSPLRVNDSVKDGVRAGVQAAEKNTAFDLNRPLVADDLAAAQVAGPEPVALTGSRRLDPQAEARAIAELRAYSDRELAELGVARHSIPEVVRNGRPDDLIHLDTDTRNAA